MRYQVFTVAAVVAMLVVGNVLANVGPVSGPLTFSNDFTFSGGVVGSEPPALSTITGFGTGVATALGNALNGAGGINGTVTWPTSSDLILSSGGNAPTGLAEVDGDCAFGAASVWTVATCATVSGNNNFTGTNTFGTVVGSGRSVSGTTDTLSPADCGTVITYTSATAVTVTTLASIVSSSGVCAIQLYQHGTGIVTIADGAGATHVSFACPTGATAGQYAKMGLEVDGNAGVSEYNVGGQCS